MDPSISVSVTLLLSTQHVYACSPVYCFVCPPFRFDFKAGDRGRFLEGEVERLNEELLRARRAVKSAVTLQVPADVIRSSVFAVS